MAIAQFYLHLHLHTLYGMYSRKEVDDHLFLSKFENLVKRLRTSSPLLDFHSLNRHFFTHLFVAFAFKLVELGNSMGRRPSQGLA